MNLHCNSDNSFLFVNGKEIFKFKAKNRNNDFPTQFCLGSISNGFGDTECREASLKGIVYDHNVFDKSDILNICKYLMVKNDIK